MATSARELPLEDFYLGYQKTARSPGEFVARDARAAPRADALTLRAYKISKRYDQDISAVFACFALSLDGARIVDRAHRMRRRRAAIPKRATAHRSRARRASRGTTRRPTPRCARSASEFTPIDDMRAIAGYRRAVLGNLMRRLRLETSGGRVARIDDAIERCRSSHADSHAMNAPREPALRST